MNNTDILVTDDLMERGIPASDIVIGFLPEYMRAYSGFAVA
ncbi:MAG: XisI protein [Spirosoma sp.]|nr:XisI protein [Spirosoma sp.]